MRRQPIYFLVDTAKSMAGYPIECVSTCIKQAISRERQNPYSIETMYISVITYGNNELKTILPFTELAKIDIPLFHCSGKSKPAVG